MKAYLFVLSMCLTLGAFAQKQEFKTKKGNLILVPVEHATFTLTYDKTTVYVDPTGTAAAFKDMAAPDLILITDIHGDHFDIKTLEALATPKTTIIAPQAVADKLTPQLKKNVKVLRNTENTDYKNFSITAVAMYNLPESEVALHPKGRGNGYLLKVGGRSLYISGDTEDTVEMRKLKDIDIALVCMNLPYTMDVNQAASAVLTFKPNIVIPYHYKGQDVTKFKELVNASNKKIEVRLLNWYPEN